jgi:hypothetical protein
MPHRQLQYYRQIEVVEDGGGVGAVEMDFNSLRLADFQAHMAYYLGGPNLQSIPRSQDPTEQSFTRCASPHLSARPVLPCPADVHSSVQQQHNF